MKAILFPGQGTQRKGMGGAAFSKFPEIVRTADEVLGYSVERLCAGDPERTMDDTLFVQPAIFVVNALHFLASRQDDGGAVSHFAGHSLGEYNALWAAGAFDFATGLRLVQQRAALMARATGGSMVAIVGLTREELERALEANCATGIAIGNHNAPRQVVLSGRRAEVDRIAAVLRRAPGVRVVMPLRTSGAFHSPEMAEASTEFARYLESVDICDPKATVIANVTGEPYPRGQVRALLADQIRSPVLWVESVRRMRAAGVTEFVEIGEGGGILRRMVDEIVKVDAAPPPKSGLSERAGSPLVRAVAERLASRGREIVQVFHGEQGIEERTGAHVLSDVNAIGAALAAVVEPQQRVLLCFPQGLDFVAALLACLHANVVAVPVPVSSADQLVQKRDVVRSLLANSGAKVVLCDGTFAPGVSGLVGAGTVGVLDIAQLRSGARPVGEARSIAGTDLALILFTSGSTARPRGVMLTHDAIFKTASARAWTVSGDSRLVSWLPQFHAFGLTFGTLTPLVQGAKSITFAPEDFVRDPKRWFELVARYRATHTGAPNFAFAFCCDTVDMGELRDASLASLQALVSGGDTIDKRQYDRFAEKFATLGLRGEVLMPNYGMSEAGPLSLKRPGEAPRWLAVDKEALRERRVVRATGGASDAGLVMGCGRVVEETRVVAVDPETGEPCGPDTVGELWVKTDRQALGYLDDPEQSEATFNGVLRITGEDGFLRTGDLGFIVDDEVYIVGRSKDVIVIRGKKYEPSDVERAVAGALAGHRMTTARGGGSLPCAAFGQEVEGRLQVVVVQETDAADEESAEAYAEVAQAIVSTVSASLQVEVYDVVFVGRGGIPVTGSRKLRRSALRDLLAHGTLAYRWRRHGPPANAAPGPGRDGARGGTLARLRSDVLLPEIGSAAACLDPARPLHELGLDSIRYIRLARRVEATFGVPFKPSTFYSCGSPAEIAAYIDAQAAPERGSTDTRRAGLPAAHDRLARVPLSESQRGLWALQKMEPSTYAYNVPVCLFAEDIDLTALERAFRHTVATHPILGAVVCEDRGPPSMLYGDGRALDLEEIDISAIGHDDVRAELLGLTRRPFDLARGPLVRLSVLRRGPSEIYVLLVAHHVVLDGSSTGIVIATLLESYQACIGRQPLEAPRPRATFAQFVEWEASLLTGSAAGEARSFWSEELAGCVPLTGMPIQSGAAGGVPSTGDVFTRTLSRPQTAEIRAFCVAHRVTPAVFCLAAFTTLLHRYTGQEDLVIGVPVTHRPMDQLDEVVGHFVNMLPLRSLAGADLPFLKHSAALEKAVMTAMGHAGYPFSRVVQDLRISREGGRSPLFQIAYNYESHSLARSWGELLERIPAASAFRLVDGIYQTGEYELTLDVVPGDDLAFHWKYNPLVYGADTVARMADHLVVLIDGVLASSGAQSIERLPILPPQERRTVVEEWNRTDTAYASERTCVDLFDDHATASPARPALTAGGITLTYGELAASSKAIAAAIADRAGSGDRVAICADRNTGLVAGILGILRTGAAYLPLDPELPVGRLAPM
ncbi:MAG: ACP S-malonyltransferase, partial [Polyangiaceae bacterium]|nr:ACP S-malonyltransferase [Polyangiaceae bacterium]